VAHLEYGEIIVEREARLAGEEAAIAAAAAEGRDRGGKIAAGLRLRAVQRMCDIVDASAAAKRLPGRGHRPVDEAAFGVARRPAGRRDLADDRLDHRETVEPVILVLVGAGSVDQREGIEGKARGERELDEASALELDRVLEAAPVIDHHDLGARAAKGSAELL